MKSLLSTLFTVTMTLCVIAVIGLIAYGVIHPDVKPFDTKEYAKENHCPYEGYECPNAQAVILRDSLAYINLEQSVDSLINSNDSLRAQLAACELQDHSQLTKH